MKKILFPILLLAICSAFLNSALTGCSQEQKQSDTIDSAVIKPEKLMQDFDSTTQDMQGNENIITVTGEVIDRAKSEVTIKTSNGEEMDFTFENLRDANKDYYHCEEGDKITIQYIKVKENGEDNDSVISLEQAK